MTRKPIVEIQSARIRIESILACAPASGHGASLLFTGVVRETNLGRKVVSVSYDAFPALAEATLRDICAEAQQRWGADLAILLLHRIGTLEVGEVSVLIQVSSPHRGEAYEASRYLIENLKHRAPIWKKETYVDGESDWLEGHALCQTHESGGP